MRARGHRSSWQRITESSITDLLIEGTMRNLHSRQRCNASTAMDFHKRFPFQPPSPLGISSWHPMPAILSAIPTRYLSLRRVIAESGSWYSRRCRVVSCLEGTSKNSLSRDCGVSSVLGSSYIPHTLRFCARCFLALAKKSEFFGDALEQLGLPPLH